MREAPNIRGRVARFGSVLACAAAAMLLAACSGTTSGVSGGGWSTIAALPAGLTGSPTPSGPTAPANPRIVTADLGETSASAMFIHMSATTAPAGKVTFVVTNSDTMTHEFVVLQTDTPAGAFPVTSFEGESNRIDEDAAGTNVGETGDMEAGTSKLLTIDLSAGHYALLCNLPGHYAAGMHVDFWATPKGATPVLVALGDTSATQMYVHLSQPYAPAGPVAFVVTNESTTMKHELVGFSTKTPAGAYPITGFEGDPNRIDEDTAGPVVVDTGDALDPGASTMITTDLKPGHYALLCNLPGHYAAGMHVDFWATPKGATPVLVALGDTSATQMYVHLSQPYAPAGPVAFVVTNESTTMKHELVGFSTKTPAGAYPITGFEGDPNRIDEDTAGPVVVDTGDALDPGASTMITTDLKPGHYALLCNLPGHYAAGMHVDFWATPKGATPVLVALGDTSATQMYVHLSQPYAPAGPVAFVVTNESTTMKHELVGFSTKTPAGAYPITGFEGDPNRIDEDTAGPVVVDTGDALDPGASTMITTDLKPGHYALLCNLPGHYAAGMHVDFWATPKGAVVTADLGETSASAMFIHMSATTAPAGKVTFVVTNSDTMTHEFVVLQTDTPAGAFPVTSFEGESNRIDEDAAGTNVGETGDMEAGTSKLLTIDLSAGHYALLCNLPGHYAAGMHVDFWAA